jgi:hypothetical protein
MTLILNLARKRFTSVPRLAAHAARPDGASRRRVRFTI